MKTLLQHTYKDVELNAALIIRKNLNKLKFIRVSPLGEGKDMNNPIDVANINAKRRRGVTNFNSYEYRYKNNILYIKTEEIHKNNRIFEKIYTYTLKP